MVFHIQKQLSAWSLL